MAAAGGSRRAAGGALGSCRFDRELGLSMADAAIRFDDLTLGYGRHPAVHHLAGEIASGSLTAIVGPNGAGKSTLLKGIVGSLRPLAGRIALSETARIAYLPQAAELDRTFPLSVYDLVAMGLWQMSGLFGGIGRKDKAKIDEAIAAVGLTGFERRSIGTLSGGQMQRVLFARLLLQDASLILLDEPFTAIDAKTTADLLDLVRRWHDEERTVVAVLHDVDMVRRIFPQTLLIAREAVAWGETGDVLNPENLLRARRMVEANDPFAQACERA
jgi:zinc/manganese transport system ATP-binding protein